VGLAYLLAFVLRLTCWRVFFGSRGLEPTSDQINWFNRSFKNRAMPPWLYGLSILWVYHADWFIQLLLIIGAISGLGALLHIYTYWCIGAATCIYASLQAMHSGGFPVGGHRILANIGFVMFMSWLCGASDESMLVLVRAVYVLIMFYSGLTKELTDKGWSKLLHMDYHYWTQPLPTILGFWLNHLPHWFHAASTFASLAIELTSPVLASWNAYTRLLSFIISNGLVVMINTCGNFGFFGFPLYVASISFFDDKDIAVLTSGIPSLSALLAPDFTWLTTLSTTEQVCLFLYIALSSYVAVQAFPANFAAFFESDAWYNLPIHVLLGTFLYSPYFFYWTSPKRRHEGCIEVRTADGKWHELHFKHGSGMLDKLSPITGGSTLRLPSLRGSYGSLSSYTSPFCSSLLASLPSLTWSSLCRIVGDHYCHHVLLARRPAHVEGGDAGCGKAPTAGPDGR
jgi:hypothetical protein